MAPRLYINLAFLLSLAISEVIAAPLMLAAIDFTLKSEKKTKPAASESHSSTTSKQPAEREQSASDNIQQQSAKDEVSKANASYNEKVKIRPMTEEKDEKLIQGYRTTTDRKGNQKTEYVYGVVKKNNTNSAYSGYLYGEDNKRTYVYGNPSRGSMQDYKHGTINVDTPRD